MHHPETSNNWTQELPPKLLKQIKGSQIQALPLTATKVLELSKNPENGPQEYAVAISADPGLAAQILRFANSSFFGFKHKIATIQMALSLISTRTIKNFIIWNAVFAMMPNPRIGSFVLKLVFQDALRRGVFCKIYGSYFNGPDPEELFVAGLFQDIALPVLVQNWPKEYEDIFEQIKSEGGRISVLEQDIFGWDHSQAGAYLVNEWKVGEGIANSVYRHKNTNIGDVKTEEDLCDAIVALSSLIPSAKDGVWKETDEFFVLFQKLNQLKRFLGNRGVPLPLPLFSEVDSQYEDMLQITQTPSPARNLVAFQRQYFLSFGDDDGEEG